MLNENQVIRLILGFKLRYLRQQKGLSYQELSAQTGLSTSYLNDIEKGKRYPKPDKITALAQALGVDYNYMVATNASKKLQPIIDLIHSNFFKLFPLQEFGISLEKLLELFTQTPDKVNAFISTIFKIARNFQIDETMFYKEALRSYQDMHNNHFPEIEEATRKFKSDFSIGESLPFTQSFLEDQLHELYDITVDDAHLSENSNLRHIRSFYNPKKKTLYIQKNLTEAQRNFILAREIGFQFLDLKERPLATTVIRINSFDELLNNYKASHFSAALLMPENELVNDIREMARANVWDPKSLPGLMKKYNATGEMLLQRFTNVLPHHFGLEDLFFLRLNGDDSNQRYSMTKDLHLSQLHSPYNNELEEHYCNRWVSVTSIQELNWKKKSPMVVDAQISKYWNTDKEYLCLSIAKPSYKDPRVGVSVTLGLLVTPQLRSIFYFLTDPKLKKREVHTTCERCGVQDCKSRVAPSIIIEKREFEASVIQDLGKL
ncbi:MAG: helix-turn-helix domain-containing protein [Bacteroidia bacterium]|nr:helix-turn-helix domain-containing protein [Bacteroidia bacterium]